MILRVRDSELARVVSAPRHSRVKSAWNCPFFTSFLAWHFGEKFSASETQTPENVAHGKFHPISWQKQVPGWILVPEVFFSESFGCLGCFVGGNHRIWSRGCSRGKGQEPMSSQVRQPCQALELTPKSWLQIPWRADHGSASFQKLPLGSGMVAGFGVDFGGIFKEMHGSAVTQNPHTQFKKTAPKSAPQIRAKIRTQNLDQNPHQNPHPKSATNAHRDPQPKGHKGCPWSDTLLLLAQVSENQKIAPIIRYATQGEAWWQKFHAKFHDTFRREKRSFCRVVALTQFRKGKCI